MNPVDAQGKTYQVGQKVARAGKIGRADGLFVYVVEVTAIKDGVVYLDNHKVGIKFPERMVIIA